MKYSVKFLCGIMAVNRSGYYKWLTRKGTPNRYEKARASLTLLLEIEHKKHKSYGYHRLAKNVREITEQVFSDNLAHKCCKVACIHSLARQRKYRKPGAESLVYENLIAGRWRARKPLEIVVSDMTCISHKGTLYEWTLFVDVYNNEILAHDITHKRGNNLPYYHCLDVLNQKVGLKNNETAPTILHTDQGAVYSSQAFAKAHEQYNIIRSMSRAGTPTDNPIMEALNGWMKDELYWDFDLKNSDNIQATLNNFVHYFNHDRAAYSLDYKSPIQFKTEQGF